MMEIAEYLLIRRLGSGGMGSVWLAHNSRLETNCAIKLIHPESDFDAGQALQRLMREGLAIAKLSHPNVVAVRDIIPLPEKQSAALVMDYFDGKPILSLVPPPGLALPFERVARILIQCAAGLDHAHERGIIHRDVKPLNILADESDFVVIVDFGIAKSQGTKSQLTTGLAIGTPHYMAPEQINMGAVDGRADQYALAVMAYNLLTGTMPLKGPDTQALALAILTMPPPPASTQNSALPVTVDGVLSKALAKSPEHRFTSCTSFVDALTGALGFSSGQLEQLRAGIPKKPRREGGELTIEERVALSAALAERAHRAANPPAPIRENDPRVSPVPLDSATAAVVGWGMGKAFWIGMPAILVLLALLGWAVTRERNVGPTGTPPADVSPAKSLVELACLKEGIAESICVRFTQSCQAKEGKDAPTCITDVKTFKVCLGLMGNEVDKCLQ